MTMTTNISPKPRVALYIRNSTDNQDIHLSAAVQEAALRHRAEMLGADADVFVDLAVSGSTTERPQFKAMMTKVFSPKKPYIAVIVNDLGRFTRNTEDYIQYEKLFADAGVELISLMDPPPSDAKIDTNRRMRTVMNEDQCVISAQKTRAGQFLATELGFFIGIHPPFGYLKVKVIWGNKEHTKLVPDPENWHNLLWIIDMAKRKYTLGEIIVELVSAGVRRPDGGEWTHDCLSRLLRHTALLGWTSRGWRSESRFLHKAEVVVCKDAHPAALTEEEREQIIQLLENRNRQAKPARSNRSSNPVSDRCVCGVCGNSMQVHDDGKHIRLMCVKNRRTKRLKPDGKPERCPNKSVRLDVFIEKTIEAIMNHILTRPVLRRQIKLVESANKDAIAEHEEGRKRIKKRRTALAKEIANIVGNIAKYGGSKTLRIELDKREEEDGLLQAQLEMMQENIRNALEFINDPELTIANALNLRTYLESEDPHDLKVLLVSLINRASFLNKKVTLEYVVPLPKNGTEEPILSELITLDPKTCPSVLRAGMNPSKGAGCDNRTSRPRTVAQRPWSTSPNSRTTGLGRRNQDLPTGVHRADSPHRRLPLHPQGDPRLSRFAAIIVEAPIIR